MSEKTAQEQAVEIFREYAETASGEKASVGLLPANGGISVRIVAGKSEFISLNKLFRRRKLTLDLLSKHKNQSQAYSALCIVGNGCEVNDFAAPVICAEVKAEPNFVGKDGDYWIYSLSVELMISI